MLWFWWSRYFWSPVSPYQFQTFGDRSKGTNCIGITVTNCIGITVTFMFHSFSIGNMTWGDDHPFPFTLVFFDNNINSSTITTSTVHICQSVCRLNYYYYYMDVQPITIKWFVPKIKWPQVFSVVLLILIIMSFGCFFKDTIKISHRELAYLLETHSRHLFASVL